MPELLNYERECYLCHSEINVCNGYVIARDFLKWLKEPKAIRTKSHVRELCGRCVLEIDLLELNNNELEKILEGIL